MENIAIIFFIYLSTIILKEKRYQSQLVQFSQVFKRNILFISQHIKHLFNQTAKAMRINKWKRIIIIFLFHIS